MGLFGSGSTCDLCLNKKFLLLAYLGPCVLSADSVVLLIRVLNSAISVLEYCIAGAVVSELINSKQIIEK